MRLFFLLQNFVKYRVLVFFFLPGLRGVGFLGSIHGRAIDGLVR